MNFQEVTTNVRTHVVAHKVPKNPPTDLLFEEGEDEFLDDELARSYIVLYESLVNTVKINEDLQGQVHQLKQVNKALEREVATLKEEILKNSMAQSELDHLRKIVRMINS